MGNRPEPQPRHLRIVSWPFHNGLRDVSMGSGPIKLANDDEFRTAIETEGWLVTQDEVEAVDESDPEIVRVIQLIRRLAEDVHDAKRAGAFPLVLAGNCNSALGTTAGLGAELGVVWFDAHADFDDPEENESGFFDVMGLAMLTGRGWRALRHTIPGHVPIPEADVVLAGVRDLEDYQRRRLSDADLTTVPDQISPDAFEAAIRDLQDRVARVYLHVDLDVIDMEEARANKYAARGGPSVARLLDCIRLAAAHLNIVGAAITAYDPEFDPDGRTLGAAKRVAGEIARGIRSQPTSDTG